MMDNSNGKNKRKGSFSFFSKEGFRGKVNFPNFKKWCHKYLNFLFLPLNSN
jgi:hypothetical protein